MKREDFLKYIDHFNNKRYEELVKYFAPDVVIEYHDNAIYRGGYEVPPAKTLHGPKEFIENYKYLHEYVDEKLEIGVLMMNEKHIFVELWTEFYCYRDPPPGSYLQYKKGDLVIMTNWVLYDLENDKFKRIRIAHFRMHDPKLTKFFKDKIREEKI
ncbi:MAG: hypothetical protein QXF23_02090 [Candidatus Bathyarchaeia archaeon]